MPLRLLVGLFEVGDVIDAANLTLNACASHCFTVCLCVRGVRVILLQLPGDATDVSMEAESGGEQTASDESDSEQSSGDKRGPLQLTDAI